MNEDQFRELMGEVRSGFEAIVDAMDRIKVSEPDDDDDDDVAMCGWCDRSAKGWAFSVGGGNPKPSCGRCGVKFSRTGEW